jgi:hypothetical protein
VAGGGSLLDPKATALVLQRLRHDAVTVLDDVLHRMRRHQCKKIPLLHPLMSWHRDGAAPPADS